MKSLLENIQDQCDTMAPNIGNCRKCHPTSSQYAMTLKQSIADMWTEHLDTYNYVVHMALDEYYQKAPEPVDGIIEALKACSDTAIVMNGATSLVCYQEWTGNPGGYLAEVRSKMYEARDGIWQGYHEVESLCDDLDKLISEALYKINILSKGCPSLATYVQSYPTTCEPCTPEV